MKWKSALLTELSGKIGGAVASKSRGGVGYFRKLVTPSNPQTTLQSAIRAAMASATQRWLSTLSAPQRAAWDAKATGSSTGQTLYNATTSLAFYANNTGRLLQTDGTTGGTALVAIDAAPSAIGTSLTAPTNVVLSAANDDLSFDINQDDPWINDAPTGAQVSGMFVYVTRGQSPSRAAQQYPYELAGVITFANGDTPPGNVDISLNELAFNFTAGEVMYLKVMVRKFDGSVSSSITRRVTVAA